MTAIINNNKMSSLEIAQVTGKRHGNIMQAIKKMEPAWEKVNRLKFQLVEYKDAKGEFRPMYQLTKIECLYIATKFNDEARAKLVLRWEELEKTKAMSIDEMILNPDLAIKALTALKVEREANIRLRDQNVIQVKELKKAAPKVEYYDKVLQSRSLISTTEIAKELGMSPNKLNMELHSRGIIYKNSGTWVLYARYQDKGYAGFRIHQYTDHSGNIQTNSHLYWTEKGREFIIKQLSGLGISDNINNKEKEV